MNQEKIGEFIAERRKTLGLTQRELAEELGISDKAVSKWETGKSLPDVSVMLLLCEKLDVSMNELLSAKTLEAEDYHTKAEENIMNLMEETQKSKKEQQREGANTVFGIIGVLVIFAFTVITSMGITNSFIYFIDSPSMIIVLGINVFFLIATNGFADFGRAFRLSFSKKYHATAQEMERSIYAVTMVAICSVLVGFLGFWIGFVAIMTKVPDLSMIGPNLAVAVLTQIYGTSIALVLVPIRVRVKQRLLEISK